MCACCSSVQGFSGVRYRDRIEFRSPAHTHTQPRRAGASDEGNFEISYFNCYPSSSSSHNELPPPDLTTPDIGGGTGQLVVETRNRNHPFSIPCSESMPEPIPEQITGDDSRTDSGADSEADNGPVFGFNSVADSRSNFLADYGTDSGSNFGANFTADSGADLDSGTDLDPGISS